MLKLAQTAENKSPWIDFSIYLLGGRQSVGGIGLLPDLKHFSELHQLLLMSSDAILALSQPPNALRFVLQAGWRQALHQKRGTTHTALFKRSTSNENWLPVTPAQSKRPVPRWPHGEEAWTDLTPTRDTPAGLHQPASHRPPPPPHPMLWTAMVEINPHSLGAFSSSAFT